MQGTLAVLVATMVLCSPSKISGLLFFRLSIPPRCALVLAVRFVQRLIVGLPALCQVRCLNESERGSGANCLKPIERRMDNSKVLRSNEDDAEVLLYVPFTTQVAFKAFVVRGVQGSAPSHVKMYALFHGSDRLGILGSCANVCVVSLPR